MDYITDAREFLNNYYSTFSTLDIESITPFFQEPCIFVSPQGVVAPQTADDVKDVFKLIADGLRSKAYGRSELINLKVQRLSDTTMLASGIADRYKANGEELERVGVTYVLQKSGDGWKIAVTVIHDA
jgi:hypothetical protein